MAEIPRAIPNKQPKRAMTGPEQHWRRHFRLTREGKVFIAVTMGVGLAAFNTGNNLIFLVFGFMMSLIVLSGILSELALRNVSVNRRLPEHSFAGIVCLVELLLRNHKIWAPSYSLEVEDVVDSMPSDRRCYFLKVAAKSRQTAGYRRIPPRRGRMFFIGFRLSTRYPFGIIEKWRNLYAPGEMLVYPALLGEQYVEPDNYTPGTEAPARRPGPGTEVAGLRDYAIGDEARNIHWIRSAALGSMVVRERERESGAQITVALDNARPPDASERWDAEFEAAVSRAATIAVSSLARLTAVEVVTRGGRSPLVLGGNSADPILRFLALLETVPAGQARPLAERAAGSRLVEARAQQV